MPDLPDDSTTTADLAIIVPHYNDVPRLRRMLEALMPQMRPGVALVIGDNASSDDLSGIRARWPDLHIVTETRRGAAEARNTAVAATTAPALAFIDSDCVPGVDWVSRALQIAARAGDTVTGGRVDVFDETPAPRSGAEAFETVFAFDFKTYIEKKGFTGAGNMVTTRQVFDKTGPFVAGLSEDLDWSMRAVAAGYRLTYDPDLIVSHPTRQDWGALRGKWMRLTEESWGLKANDGRHDLSARFTWALRALIVLPVSIPVHLPRIFWHAALTPAEKRAAAMTLIRLRLLRVTWMMAQVLRG